ncbi:hypothetical protein KKG55_02185 [Candidatus Micrarchaeota archaeon]|nr:hypothetical protein [Candidatus Micrarchaeota archaeon]
MADGDGIKPKFHVKKAGVNDMVWESRANCAEYMYRKKEKRLPCWATAPGHYNNQLPNRPVLLHRIYGPITDESGIKKPAEHGAKQKDPNTK